ncbi:MAG TPA: alpha/beta hydrolase [Candidatus Angelobacter sp.]|nr:alpha/beta hydrolase [Candidatus Angelobacter sp.]
MDSAAKLARLPGFTAGKAILWGGLVAGTLDAADGVIALATQGLNPIQVLQYIASGALGPSAFQGGLATAGLGALFHFLIALAAAAVFVVASGKIPVLRTRAVVLGLLYGAAVYFFMNDLVLPALRGGFHALPSWLVSKRSDWTRAVCRPAHRALRTESAMIGANLRNATAVLVHAAWADASSWSRVVATLQQKGLQVVSVQIPLTSLTDDVAAVRRALAKLEGPVVLAGHSYGGAVITSAGGGHAAVKALVYIAAMAPDEGETVGQLLHRAPTHAAAPQLIPDEEGLLWMSAEGFANAVAPESPAQETAIMRATQKPISIKCLGETTAYQAWREKPSWFLGAERDRMISPDTQRFMAQRAHSTIRALPVDHSR